MIRAATQGEIDEISGYMGYCPSRRAKGIIFLEKESIGSCVLYDHWTLNSVQVHVYAPSLKALFDAGFLREIFTFPFVTGGRNLLVACTPADQRGSLAVSSWLGFKEKYRIKDGWGLGIDMVLKELRREDCRFLAKSVESESSGRFG